MNLHPLKKFLLKTKQQVTGTKAEHKLENKRTSSFTTKMAIQSGLAHRPSFHVVRRWLAKRNSYKADAMSTKAPLPFPAYQVAEALGILPGLLGLLSGLTHSLLLLLIILLKILCFRHFLGADHDHD